MVIERNTDREEYLDRVYKIYVQWQGRPKFKLTNDVTQDDVAKARKAGVMFNEEDFCERYKVSKEDLMAFQKRDTYSNDIRSEAVLHAKAQLPDIMATATNKAKNAKSVKDIKDWADMIEDLKKKVVDNPDERALFERLSDADYERIVKREVKAYAAKGGIFDEDWSNILALEEDDNENNDEQDK